jgi:hypothetical protein
VLAIKDAIRNRSKEVPICFIPRHAVRSVKSGKVVDLVICFQCSQYREYRNSEHYEVYLISKEAPAILNTTLTDAGVPLAAKDLGF